MQDIKEIKDKYSLANDQSHGSVYDGNTLTYLVKFLLETRDKDNAELKHEITQLKREIDNNPDVETFRSQINQIDTRLLVNYTSIENVWTDLENFKTKMRSKLEGNLVEELTYNIKDQLQALPDSISAQVMADCEPMLEELESTHKKEIAQLQSVQDTYVAKTSRLLMNIKQLQGKHDVAKDYIESLKRRIEEMSVKIYDMQIDLTKITNRLPKEGASDE